MEYSRLVCTNKSRIAKSERCDAMIGNGGVLPVMFSARKSSRATHGMMLLEVLRQVEAVGRRRINLKREWTCTRSVTRPRNKIGES